MQAEPNGALMLRGAQAVAFGEEFGIDAIVLAAIVVTGRSGDLLVVFVAQMADGAQMACWGEPNENGKAIIKRYFGVGA